MPRAKKNVGCKKLIEYWPTPPTVLTATCQAVENLNKLLGAVPESLWWLFGAGYLGYTGARSFDKWRGPAR